jgi:hypothetical protein
VIGKCFKVLLLYLLDRLKDANGQPQSGEILVLSKFEARII